MLSLDDRVLAVLTEAWRLLPSLKIQAYLTSIGLERLGNQHGSYNPEDGTLILNVDLFTGETPAQIRLIDADGNDPPLSMPCVSRALHTTIHELTHAIGTATGLDESPEWLALSGWVEASDDPEGTSRYWESRPGWTPQGHSEWRHRLGCWFTRDYARRSPFELFADACTHIALGWTTPFAASPNGLAKLRYLRREVWGEMGTVALTAARDRWHQRFVPRIIRAQSDNDDAEEEDEEKDPAFLFLLGALRKANAAAELEALRLPLGRFSYAEGVYAVFAALVPFLVRQYRAAWDRVVSLGEMPLGETPGIAGQLVAMQRAAQSYVDTTVHRLATRLEEAQTDGATETAQRQVVRRTFEEANTARARQLARTEGHRVEEAARMAALQEAGEEFGVWRTTSAKPCEYCAALEGTKVHLGEALFLKGHRLQGGNGREMKLDYEDVFHPPLHPSCVCELRGE